MRIALRYTSGKHVVSRDLSFFTSSLNVFETSGDSVGCSQYERILAPSCLYCLIPTKQQILYAKSIADTVAWPPVWMASKVDYRDNEGLVTKAWWWDIQAIRRTGRVIPCSIAFQKVSISSSRGEYPTSFKYPGSVFELKTVNTSAMIAADCIYITWY